MSNSFKYVKEYYKLPFIKRGMRVCNHGRPGKVTSANSRVRVLFDGWTKPVNCHPTWEMIYYAEDGSVLADFTERPKGVL